MKPQPNEKKDRNVEMRETYRTRKDLSLSQIGDLYGVSRQRVFQIVVRRCR